MIDGVAFLQQWFVQQADGEWEHHDGILIESLDNPGWYLSVSLVGTVLEGRLLDYAIARDDDPRWVHCWSTGDRFEAASGPLGLGDALEQFRKFATSGAEVDQSTA